MGMRLQHSLLQQDMLKEALLTDGRRKQEHMVVLHPECTCCVVNRLCSCSLFCSTQVSQVEFSKHVETLF